jgi:hypothetical protein
VSGREEFAMPPADAALRHCALTLHSVDAPDRAWLLAQLPPDQRLSLEQLVAELQAIGIPRDPQTARTAMAFNRNARAATEDDGASDAQGVCARVLASAAASDVAELLQGEPPALIALILRGQTRERSDAILKDLNAFKRQRVQSLLKAQSASGNDAPPRLLDGLLTALAQRLERRTPRPARPQPAAHWLARWRRQLSGVAR